MSGDAPASAARVRDCLSGLSGWRRPLAAFLAGTASVLAFAPFHLFPVLFLTLPVLLWLIDASPSPRQAAVAGWWFGFGYFLFNLFWIGEAFLVEADKFAWLIPFAVTLLPAGIALFWGLAAFLMRRFWFAGPARVALFALLFGIAEWLRGHLFTGLPWNVIGYALTYPLELMQSAALFGVYALSFVAIPIFTLPLVLISEAERQGRRAAILKAVLVAAVPLMVMFAFGSWRLGGDEPPDLGLKVRIVQPSVPQREKWMAEKQGEIFSLHLTLSSTNPSGARDDLDGIALLVWPEAAMPFLPLEHPEALSAIGDLLPDGTQLVSGALRRTVDAENVMHGFNSMMAFDSSGKLVSTYDKVHLVPFGEYLPMTSILGALGLQKLTKGLGAFDTGPYPRPLLAIPGLPPVGGLICYEVLFPGEVVVNDRRPGLIVNVTNDGWFGDTTGPRQHFHQTRVRAVEEGVPIVRAANNGISAVIDGFGRTRTKLDLNVRGVADSLMPAALPMPFFARLRDSIFWSLAALLALVSVVQSRRL